MLGKDGIHLFRLAVFSAPGGDTFLGGEIDLSHDLYDNRGANVCAGAEELF